mgnify:CR=1 FL=1
MKKTRRQRFNRKFSTLNNEIMCVANMNHHHHWRTIVCHSFQHWKKNVKIEICKTSLVRRKGKGMTFLSINYWYYHEPNVIYIQVMIENWFVCVWNQPINQLTILCTPAVWWLDNDDDDFFCLPFSPTVLVFFVLMISGHFMVILFMFLIL